MSRPQVVKKLWEYIRRHELQNPLNRKEIICDDALRAVFAVDKIDMFRMNKVLGQYVGIMLVIISSLNYFADTYMMNNSGEIVRSTTFASYLPFIYVEGVLFKGNVYLHPLYYLACKTRTKILLL